MASSGKYSNVADGLLAHHTYASHLRQSLAWSVSEYCDAAPWKLLFKGGDDEKGIAPPEMTAESLRAYGAADARLTYDVWQRMQPDLAPEKETYLADLALGHVCREMGQNGVHVDQTRRAALRLELLTRGQELRESLARLTGAPAFRPGAPADVRKFLYRDIGLRYTRLTKGGLPATDETVLEGLRLSPNEEIASFASQLLTWRVVDKIRSTYIDGVTVYPDGRARFNWKSFGTVSGRLASKLQSVPRYDPRQPESRIREVYDAAPGNVLIYYDVSQAEMRLAAYLSNDPVFIEACRGDVHWNNALAVMPAVSNLDKKQGKGKEARDIAKSLGFAINYCAEADKLYATLAAKGFQVSLTACQLILRKLHTAYRVYYQWVEQNLAACRATGYLRSPFLGRIRWLGWYPKITDVANSPIQSGLADIMNRRTVTLRNELSASQCGLVAQAHDACIYEAREEYASTAQGIIASVWAEPITTAGGAMVLPIDLKIGNRWSDF